MTPVRPIVIALLVVPETSAATVYGLYDLLCATRRDWQRLHQAVVPARSRGPLVSKAAADGASDADDASLTPATTASQSDAAGSASPFQPIIVSSGGASLVVDNGVRIVPEAGLATCVRPDVACVADLRLTSEQTDSPSYSDEIGWLRRCFDDGALIATVGTGALLLAATGLLDGRDATSHWAYCNVLARQYPRVRWWPQRHLIATGPQRRLMMSAGGTSWHMLALALIARYAGVEEAMRVARLRLIDAPAVSPPAYASLTQGLGNRDPVILRCQRWAARHYGTESPVSRMVEVAGVPERTFKRRFARAAGLAPLEYIHALRLEQSKHKLETESAAVNEIAFAVGYKDPSFFGRLFRRKVAMTPAQYRRRFGGLRSQLQALEQGGGGNGFLD